MTPDIQELKRLAEAANATSGRACPHWIAYIAAASPSTILALIEVAEAAEEAHEARKRQSFTDLLLAMERIRTALEGVKK